MKILIVGDANSVFIQKHIEEVLLPHGYSISLICDRKSDIRFAEFYQMNSVELIETAAYFWTFIDKVPKVRGIVHRLYSKIAMNAYIKQFGSFDIVHIHGMWNYSWDFSLAKYANSVICSYWGSDLFRSPQTNRHMIDCLMRAKYITISTKEMKQKFNEIFGLQFDEKIRSVKFGVTAFEAINALLCNTSKEDCKRSFGIAADKIVVSIGYNAKHQHQHLAVLAELAHLTFDQLSQITLVLQMTCGAASQSYLDSVDAALRKLPCESIVFSTFMDINEVAKLRIATDIFIHAQTTDAFSASVQEYLYAGATLINPTWIKYGDLKDANIDYFEYHNFSELPSLLLHCISNSKEEFIIAEDRKKLYNLSSWKSVSSQWAELYDTF